MRIWGSSRWWVKKTTEYTNGYNGKWVQKKNRVSGLGYIMSPLNSCLKWPLLRNQQGAIESFMKTTPAAAWKMEWWSRLMETGGRGDEGRRERYQEDSPPRSPRQLCSEQSPHTFVCMCKINILLLTSSREKCWGWQWKWKPASLYLP